MELLFKRDQKSGMMGGIKFYLTAKAKLTSAEITAVNDYKMGSLILYEKPNAGPSSDSITSAFMYRMTVPRVVVSDLVNGKTIEAKDIGEIMSAERQLKEAAEVFHQMLMAAKSFHGETVHTFADA